jgi:hypothetical protein
MLEREGEIIDWRNKFANRLEALCILEYIKKTGLVWNDGSGALRVSQNLVSTPLEPRHDCPFH